MANNINDIIKQGFKMADQERELSAKWHRYLVSTVSVVLGIMVSLRGKPQESALCSLLFALSFVLFSLGVVALGLSAYNELGSLRKGRSLYAEEIKRAQAEHRDLRCIMVQKQKLYKFCEAVGYICCVLGLLVLCGYVLLPVVEAWRG